MIKNQKEITGVSMIEYEKSTGGSRQACCVTESVRFRMPRPTSSPTRCAVGERGGVLKRP